MVKTVIQEISIWKIITVFYNKNLEKPCYTWLFCIEYFVKETMHSLDKLYVEIILI